MDLTDINHKIEENKMDIQSPYIKASGSSIEEVRKRIIKRASSNESIQNEDRVLSFKNKEDKPESDDVLKQKVFNISKRIVGEEIKKFAEIASREIGKEFSDIENRINQNVNENIVNLQNELDKKIERFNYNIKDLESRIRDLEILSIGTIKKEENRVEKNILAESEKKNKEITNQDEIKNVFEEKEIDTKKEKGSKKDVKRYYAAVEVREEEAKYVSEKVKEISNSFEKSGLLFRKNSYVSKFKELITEEFLNNKEEVEYRNIDSGDKEKMYKILTGLMDKLNIDPTEDEKIEDFLKRAYRVEFQEENSI